MRLMLCYRKHFRIIIICTCSDAEEIRLKEENRITYHSLLPGIQYLLHSFLKHSSCLSCSESDQIQGWQMQQRLCGIVGKSL